MERATCMRAAAILAALSSTCVFAQGFTRPDQGKLTATGGVTQIEGAGGGGLTPWALITGYGSRDSYGGNAHYTFVDLSDYSLGTYGIAAGFYDRFEVSVASWRFKGTDGALDGVKIEQDVVGLKLRVAGDAVYGQDTWLPQVALGVQFKRNKGITGLEALGVSKPTDLGAKDNDGTDYYVAATKVFLDQSLLANVTARFTKANQFGLLGFGGDREDKYKLRFEGSVAYLVTRKLAVGAEYRAKPHNLGVDDEGSAKDVFIAWFPTKNFSVTAAYVDLGTIVKPFVPGKQRGAYLSGQIGF